MGELELEGFWGPLAVLALVWLPPETLQESGPACGLVSLGPGYSESHIMRWHGPVVGKGPSERAAMLVCEDRTTLTSAHGITPAVLGVEFSHRRNEGLGRKVQPANPIEAEPGFDSV